MDRSVAVHSGRRLQRRPGPDESQEGGRVAPHGGVVEGPVPVRVLGVSVRPFPQEPGNYLPEAFHKRSLRWVLCSQQLALTA